MSLSRWSGRSSLARTSVGRSGGQGAPGLTGGSEGTRRSREPHWTTAAVGEPRETAGVPLSWPPSASLCPPLSLRRTPPPGARRPLPSSAASPHGTRNAASASSPMTGNLVTPPSGGALSRRLLTPRFLSWNVCPNPPGGWARHTEDPALVPGPSQGQESLSAWHPECANRWDKKKTASGPQAVSSGLPSPRCLHVSCASLVRQGRGQGHTLLALRLQKSAPYTEQLLSKRTRTASVPAFPSRLVGDTQGDLSCLTCSLVTGTRLSGNADPGPLSPPIPRAQQNLRTQRRDHSPREGKPGPREMPATGGSKHALRDSPEPQA